MSIKRMLLRIAKNFKFLPKETFLKIRYQYYTGKKLNLKNPVEFNEKIQWLKLYYHVPILTKLADKHEVREYVTGKIGEKYLNKLYGVYDKVEDINFDKLPSKFVLKAVHGSSTNLIVTNKNELDIKKTKKLMQKWLKHNQYKKVGFEWAYKNIKPRIISEAFLGKEGDKLIDYKFYCFNGKPKFVLAIFEDNITIYKYLDMQWNLLPFAGSKKIDYDGVIDKPSNFEEMKKLATILADKFPFVRVDFYSIEGETIFGEMTFYPTDGMKDFRPDKYNKILGDYMTLPKIPKGKKVITVY